MSERLKHIARRFARDEGGASLVEYTVVIVLFLLIFFAILDFGRLGFNWVMTEKAMQRATRIAVTRPAMCPGVPEVTTRVNAGTSFGTLCREAAGTCQSPHAVGAPQQCRLGAPTEFVAGGGSNECGSGPVTVPTLGNNPTPAQIAVQEAAIRTETRQEIWCILEPILPSNADPSNIRVSYEFREDLGFVGGPYVPMVEIGVVTQATDDPVVAGASELRFEFITPIPALIAAVGSTATQFQDNDSDSLADIPFPELSVSMPGEDLNRGNGG